MNRTAYGVALAVGLILAAGGCASLSATPAADRAHVGYLSPSLVMPTTALRGDDAESGLAWPVDSRSWEYGRNDPVVIAGTPPYHQPAWAEIRTRERLYTVNGRPREFSTTWIRTFHHRVIRR